MQVVHILIRAAIGQQPVPAFLEIEFPNQVTDNAQQIVEETTIRRWHIQNGFVVAFRNDQDVGAVAWLRVVESQQAFGLA